MVWSCPRPPSGSKPPHAPGFREVKYRGPVPFEYIDEIARALASPRPAAMCAYCEAQPGSSDHCKNCGASVPSVARP